MSATQATTSIKPYLIRAWHEWCSDNGYTPYLLVAVDETVSVPQEFVQNAEIVLNIGFDATGHLQMGNEDICFKARFSGRVRDIYIPIHKVKAIYARENGEGMQFEVESAAASTHADASVPSPEKSPEPAGLSVVSNASHGKASPRAEEPAHKPSSSTLKLVK